MAPASRPPGIPAAVLAPRHLGAQPSRPRVESAPQPLRPDPTEALQPSPADSAFSVDMDAAAQWPVPVDITVRIDYVTGPSEHAAWRLEPLPAASVVRVENRQARGDEAPEVALIRWTDLPGKSLVQRCLHVLAVHLFGSVDMPPRITGMPLWSSLSLEISVAEDDPQAWQMELRSTGAGRAESRLRTRRGRPLETREAVLESVDADPLRALLRLGIGRAKPAARGRGAGGRPQAPAAGPAARDRAVDETL